MGNRVLLPIDPSAIKQCTSCLARKPLSEFHNYKNQRGELCKRGKCGACVYLDVQAWRKANPDKYKALNDRIGRRFRADKTRYRSKYLKDRFGLTNEQYLSQLAAQNGLCAICGKEEIVRNKLSGRQLNLAVDHHHGTGQIRGLLCHACNFILGRIENTGFDKFASYLGDSSKWLAVFVPSFSKEVKKWAR